MKQILAIVLLISAISAYNKLDLPYQAHSMNDLDLTIQELIKGVNNLKFDVSQATQESCEQYSTWNKDYSQCGFFGDFGMKTCCLGLRGDCSQQPVFNSYFNTTDDMLNMISNPKYAFIFNKNTTIQKYQKTKYFAFNFQFNSRNTSFTTDFIYNFFKIIETHNLNLKMVTGSTGLVEYFDQKCYKLKQCNEKEQYIADSDIILQEDYSLRKRSQQFNIDSEELPSTCASGFPKYMKNSDIPFQFWEPSYQDAVYDVVDQFWSNRCLKIGIKNAKDRFKITSNVNSENYATFLQRANQTSKVQYVPPKYRFNNSTQSLIEHNYDLKLTFISRYNTLSSKYELNIYDDVSFKHSTTKALDFENKIMKLSTKGSFLVVETSSTIEAYQIVSKKELKKLGQTQKQPNYLVSDFVILNDIKPHFVVTSIDDGNLSVELIDIVTNSIKQKLIQAVKDVQADGFKYVSSIFKDAKVVSVYSYEQINKKNNISEIQFFYLAFDTLSTIFYQPSSPMNYGSNSSLKIQEYNGKLYFVQVSGNGSCWSGVFINNGDWSKCTLFQEDKFINLRNIPHTITYMWGEVDELVERIKSSSFINSCDKRILSSKVYNGKNPQITVVRDSKNKPTAYVMMDYAHYNELPILTTLFLGSNSYEEEYSDFENLKMTELLSFDLLEYEIFDLPF